MNLFQTKEYLEIFSRHFCQSEDIVNGIWEKYQGGLILLGMKPVLGGEEVTDFGPDRIIALPEGYNQIQLDYIREDSRVYSLYKSRAVKIEVSPYIDLPPTWDEYLAGLERKHRKELKRKIRRLEETAAFYQCTPGTMETDFAEFVRLHRLSDPKKKKFMSREMEAFFWDLLTAEIPGWELRLCFLKLDHRPAAALMTFENPEEVWLYNSGYDPAMAYFSAGLMLKSYQIKKAIEAGKKRYDFLRGSERYKYELGAKDLNLYRIKINR